MNTTPTQEEQLRATKEITDAFSKLKTERNWSDQDYFRTMISILLSEIVSNGAEAGRIYRTLGAMLDNIAALAAISSLLNEDESAEIVVGPPSPILINPEGQA